MLASPQELQRKLNQGDSVINRKKKSWREQCYHGDLPGCEAAVIQCYLVAKEIQVACVKTSPITIFMGPIMHE